MSTVIRCLHKTDDWYIYNVQKDIEDEHGFEVDIWVRVNTYYVPARIINEYQDQPAEFDFKIDYDSFEVQFNHHSELEVKTINEWVEIHKEKGTFEDAFGKSWHEIE
jgi:hypothetical protein